MNEQPTVEKSPSTTKEHHFDMAAAIEAARRNFPRETENILFVDNRDPNNPVVKGYGAMNLFTVEDIATIKKNTPNFANSAGFIYPISPIYRSNALFVINSSNEVDPRLKSIDEEYTFLHELGHLVMDHGMEDATFTQKNRAELSADAFATICFLKNHPDEVSFVKNDIGINTSLLACLLAEDDRALAHATTLLTDSILIDHSVSGLEGMTPQGLKRLAQRYVDTCQPSEQDLRKAQADFQFMTGFRAYSGSEQEQNLRLLAQTVLGAPTSSQTFYLGARTLAAFLQQEDFATSRTRVPELTGEFWQATRRALYDKAQRREKYAELLCDMRVAGEEITAPNAKAEVVQMFRTAFHSLVKVFAEPSRDKAQAPKAPTF